MSTKKYKVLYVDDDEKEFIYIQQKIASLSHHDEIELDWCGGYKKGLAQLLAGQYDICIANYILGEYTAIDFITYAITENSDVPIVVCGQDEETIDFTSMEAGAIDFIAKDSITARSLERTIRYNVEHKQIERELKRMNQVMQQIAEYDQLTNLPNRNLFNKTLPIVLARAERNNLVVAVMFLDLDKFKDVNDTLGHDYGDKLLAQVAERLKQVLRRTDFISRLGGDEFTVVLEGLFDVHKIAIVANKIIHAIRPVFYVEGREIYITTSVGIATTISLDNPTAENLVKCADTAMYSAKNKGRNTFQFYTEFLNKEVQERVNIENSLRHALKRNEFYLVYQPILELPSGKIWGMEVLLRWLDSSGNEIAPFEFIPVAEETGVICALGKWVFTAACEQLCEWQIKHPQARDLSISINISMRQLVDRDFINHIEQVLAATQLDPNRVVIELTETTIMSNPEESIAALNELHSLGVRISVDDFGTGYSSLAYLNCLPIHSLKIDRSFVRDVTDDPNDAIIVKAIISLAKNLQLIVIAEGVETESQLQFITANGCEYYQGFYFSRPIRANEIIKLITNQL